MALTVNFSRVPDPREVKKIADRLIDAENEVAKLKAEWAALFTASAETDESRGTLSERIVNLIQSRYEQTFTAPMVSQLLGANPNSVGPLLSRLVAEQKVRKVGHGEYQGTSPDPLWWPKDDEIAVEAIDEESPAALPS